MEEIEKRSWSGKRTEREDKEETRKFFNEEVVFCVQEEGR
jgi:hypothetical protein